MCGIAGQVGGTDARAAQMIAALAHRGPDGLRVEALAGAEVAHARLSIIDLEGGWQPLHGAGSTVIGNGEIYNYLELARDHQLTDVLATGSDFEPLLHLYAREGERAFERLRGMYAFCFLGGDGRAWLARDPFGIKPLYIMEHAGGLAFASEPRAFLKAGLMQTALDPEPARELLDFNYTLGARTLFQGLRRLAPGEVVEIRDGRIVSNWRRPWLLKPPLVPAQAGTQAEASSRSQKTAASGHPMPPSLRGDERDMLSQLDTVLEDSVRVHQRSDVPYGLFLSGGIDSAAIATLMARLNERPVTAFTCGFDAPDATNGPRPRRWRGRSTSTGERRPSGRPTSGGSRLRSPGRWTIPPPTTRHCPPTSWPRPPRERSPLCSPARAATSCSGATAAIAAR